MARSTRIQNQGPQTAPSFFAKRPARLIGAGLVTAPLALAAIIGFAGVASAADTPDAPAAVCPTDGSDIGGFQYTANGSPISGLADAAPGDVITATFTVAAGCSVQVSLVAYEAPSATYVESEAGQQTVFGTPATGTFSPGQYTLTTTVPTCFFQVDFVRGAPIYNLTPDVYSNAGALISWGNGGTTSCAVTPDPPVTPTPPVTPPVTPTPPVIPTPPVTPASVLGVSLTKTPPTAVEAVSLTKPVASVQALPFTGSNTPEMIEIAVGLIGAGVGLRVFASRRKSESKA